MSGEVLILGVKGSGKTVFLSVLGHKYEGVGEFGLSLTPDRTTWNFAYECYHTMAPEDGSEQRFPKATDPNEDPVPLTWMVRAGTEPLFRMTTLECAGETMVKAFGGQGDEEAEARYSEEMTAAFDAIDAGYSEGISSKADTVTKLRAMAGRASVVCLFLNPRDFESQVAALPGVYRERLGRTLARLREEGAGMGELRRAREANERALATARGELKDRYGAMLDLLRTFLENESYRGKRLVFVLTQSGGLERAIEEAGGAWGYINANIRQLEAFDLAGRAEAITVSAVNTVVPVEDVDGEERERPDGPIESSGLEDFLLTVGGACSPRLAHLKESRRACTDAEQKAADAVADGEPMEVRWAAAKAWRDAAEAWERAAERFIGELGSVRAAVRQRTRAFAGADALRAQRRWAAENALRERMVEDVAAGTALDAGDLEGWLEVANGAVERKGLEPWTLDDLGLERGWIAESLQVRRAGWNKLKQRFDDAIERLDWREALAAAGESELDPSGVVRRTMERQAAETRRKRAEMECRAALDGADEKTAARKLGELAQAEEEAGPSEARPALEADLEYLRSRLDVRAVLDEARSALAGLESGRANEKKAFAAVRGTLPKAASLLAAGEGEHGEEGFRDLRQELESCRLRLAKAVRRRTVRTRTHWAVATAVLAAVAAAWFALRVQGGREMARVREEALDLAAAGECDEAMARLSRMADKAWLALKASDYATADAFARIEEYREYGKAFKEMDEARKEWKNRRAAMVREFGTEDLCLELGGNGWTGAEKAARGAEQALPSVKQGADGRPDPGQDLSAVAAGYRTARKRYKEASSALERAASDAAAAAEDYRRARSALAKARKDRETRLAGIAETARREGFSAEVFNEWKELETAERAAKLAVPVPAGEALPASGGLAALARGFRDALAAGDATAERALAMLDNAVKARIARSKVYEDAERMGLADWNAAAEAARKAKLDPEHVQAVKDPEAEWQKVLGAGKADRSVQATRGEWNALGQMLADLLGNPALTPDERAFAQPHKAVCDAAEAYFSEKQHRQAVAGRKARINDARKNNHWAEAARLADEFRAAARPGSEKAEAEKTADDIRAAARNMAEAAILDPLAGKDEQTAMLRAAGYGSPELGREVAGAIRDAIRRAYPEAAPDGGVPDTFRRDAQTMEELSTAESDPQLMLDRNDMVKRVAGWSDQWLKRAEACAEASNTEAKKAETLVSAWKNCRTCEKLLGAVLGNPQAGPAHRTRVREIQGGLPSLVCLAGATRGGRPVDIQRTDYDGVHADKVRVDGEPAAVAILAAGKDPRFLKIVTVEPSMGAGKKVRLQFNLSGTKTMKETF